MEDWGAVRDRLVHDTRSRIVDRKRHMADIRAALERVEELERELARLRVERDAALVHGPEDMVRAVELLDQAATDYRRSRDDAEAKREKVVEVLSLTQNVMVGSYAAGWTVHLTGEQMKSIRATLAAAKGEE